VQSLLLRQGVSLIYGSGFTGVFVGYFVGMHYPAFGQSGCGTFSKSLQLYLLLSLFERGQFWWRLGYPAMHEV